MPFVQRMGPVVGTSRTCRDVRLESAKRSKADGRYAQILLFQPFLIGNRLLLHISPYAEHAIYVYPPMVETERLTEKHRLRARN